MKPSELVADFDRNTQLFDSIVREGVWHYNEPFADGH
jgi:hypothetical protein